MNATEFKKSTHLEQNVDDENIKYVLERINNTIKHGLELRNINLLVSHKSIHFTAGIEKVAALPYLWNTLNCFQRS